jgi:hypothetical protein
MRTIKLPEMTHRMEVIIRPRPGSKEYAVEIHKRDSFYKSIYLLQGFKTLSSLEVSTLLGEAGVFFDETHAFVSSAGRFHGRIKHNGELLEVAEFTHRCARLSS